MHCYTCPFQHWDLPPAQLSNIPVAERALFFKKRAMVSGSDPLGLKGKWHCGAVSRHSHVSAQWQPYGRGCNGRGIMTAGAVMMANRIVEGHAWTMAPVLKLETTRKLAQLPCTYASDKAQRSELKSQMDAASLSRRGSN
jgi:hypothetical protein